MAKPPPYVLFVAETARQSGPTQSLLWLLRHLRDHYRVAVLLPERGPLSSSLNAEQVRVFVYPHLRIGAVPAIVRLLRREKIDLVYGNTPSGASRNSLYAAKLAGRPFVWHVRGMKWHWGWRQGVPLGWANAVVAVSEACAGSLRRFCARERVHVVHNGIEPTVFDIDRAGARQTLRKMERLPTDAPIAISVAHIDPRKGTAQAVEIFARLSTQLPNAHLLIAGALDRRPSYARECRALVAGHGLTDRVRFLGLREDIPSLLAGADVFLHTAVRDPHPRAVLEAMATGLPIVAHAVDGVRETVVDGASGYLRSVDDLEGMADGLRILLEDPERRATMGRAARHHVRAHFSAATTADRVAAIINQVLGGAGRPGRALPQPGEPRGTTTIADAHRVDQGASL